MTSPHCQNEQGLFRSEQTKKGRPTFPLVDGGTVPPRSVLQAGMSGKFWRHIHFSMNLQVSNTKYNFISHFA